MSDEQAEKMIKILQSINGGLNFVVLFLLTIAIILAVISVRLG
jgi:hypothetical protein